MSDLPQDGPPTKSAEAREDGRKPMAPALVPETIRETSKKPVEPVSRINTREMYMNPGNFQQVITIMVETLNKNIVELTEVVKLGIPDDKLKDYYAKKVKELEEKARQPVARK